jgi:hypothetical protein
VLLDKRASPIGAKRVGFLKRRAGSLQHRCGGSHSQQRVKPEMALTTKHDFRMTFFDTRVPTLWIPSTDYRLTDEVMLRPAGDIKFQEGFVRTPMNSLFFITRSSSEEQHINLLKKWILFHAFLFPGWPDVVRAFELGKISQHAKGDHLDQIRADGSPNDAFLRDYDDVAREVYSSQDIDLRISYRESFRTYLALDAELRNLIKLWLFRFGQGRVINDLQLIDPTYLNIATKLTILEKFIGHPPNCEVDEKCPECGRQRPHRKDSEAVEERLLRPPGDESTSQRAVH